MDIKRLEVVRNTLNTITVCGAENLDRLLGCILTLQEIISKEQENENDQTE